MIAGIGASAPLRLIWAPPRSARDAYQRDYDPATLHRSAQHSIAQYERGLQVIRGSTRADIY